ncbi:MAG: TetR/AcrR family transcriptional regulator [Phenylobacterium sp.]|nr:MAG: TetR/AcrR family transcriptional regulator [Phenylobacterium sp.]
MDAAQALFVARGFADTSTTAIAEAAGVTDGALFHHFKDKKTLFREIVVRLQTQVHQAIYDAAAKATSVIEGFRLGALESMRVTQVPVYQRIVFTEAPAVLGREEWGTIDARMGFALIESRLKMIAGAEDLPDRLVKPMAILTLGTMNEATFALARKDPGVDPDEVLALLERTLLDWIERDVKPWQAARAEGGDGAHG